MVFEAMSMSRFSPTAQSALALAHDCGYKMIG
jgi:hypothetical protein